MTRPLSTYSTRARIGLIVPPTNTVNEAEWAQLLPSGATAHSHRMALHADTQSEAGKKALKDDLEDTIGMLAPMKPDVMAYACTAGSMLVPSDQLGDEMTERTGIKTVTTADSIVKALRHLGVSQVSIATPYTDAMNAHEVDFLKAHGIDTLAIEGLGLGANGPCDFPLIAQTPIAEIEALARRIFVPGSGALLITCTDFPSLPLIYKLSKEFGVPVISSNTATLWACLKIAFNGSDEVDALISAAA
ncbi:maleate cis-trans isomerase family protein [Celeribacter litoreus]|uniref:maleate cis-trans isomerase family protein n=1 Tax=Celeribacter litoreus TaxID=2876714 RepID=UPI001CCA72BE|nr:aspartate/glutamate racemase family protein [Celeribacter litoreus]MCA0042526.1 aspartate/glutamate racemase family protein [Celeribacter litoreus]